MRSATVGAGVALLAVGGTAVAVAFAAGTGRPTSGTVVALEGVGEVSLSDASAPQARARLRELQGALARRQLTLTAGAASTRVDAQKLGVRLDIAATIAAARRRPRVLSAVRSKFGGRRLVAPVLTVDAAALLRATSPLRARVTVPVQRGDVRADERGTVRVLKPRPGVELDTTTAGARVLSAVSGGSAEAALDTRSVAPPATPEALAVLGGKARAWLRRSVLLRSGPVRVQLTSRELGPLVRAVPDPAASRPALRLGVQPARAEALARAVAARVDAPARSARLRLPGAAPLLQEKADVAWSPRRAAVATQSSSADGRKVDVAALTRLLDALAGRQGSTATLPVAVLRPALSSDQARRVTRLIGTFTTFFVCCQPRVRNITAIARAVDGTVIPENGVFSLNGVAGRRTTAKGYVRAPYILGGRLSKDIGGGVSQFATTTYNAAYFAGLPLLAHQAHSFYISRYPPGREATVNYPGLDLQWRNDTAAPVVLRTAVARTSLTVSLFGDNGGRQVQARTLERQARGNGGFSLTVQRTTRYPDGRMQQHVDRTTYNPPPAGE